MHAFILKQENIVPVSSNALDHAYTHLQILHFQIICVCVYIYEKYIEKEERVSLAKCGSIKTICFHYII